MNDKANTLLAISVVFLAIAGIAFLVISIVDKSCGAWPLAASLACMVLSNIFNVIRLRRK